MAFLYPWGNTQQLNLDWILQKIKELEAGSGGADLDEVANALISASYSRQAYDRSDIVFHDGKLYRANQAIPAPGEVWTPAHWDEILLGDTVSNLVQYVAALSNDQIANSSTVSGTHTSDALNTLKNAIDNIPLDSDNISNESQVTGDTVSEALDTLNDTLTPLRSMFQKPAWEIGSISTTSGVEAEATNQIRSDYIRCDANTRISCASDFQFIVCKYNLDTMAYEGASGTWQNTEYNIGTACWCRIIVRKNDQSTITDTIQASEYLYLGDYEIHNHKIAGSDSNGNYIKFGDGTLIQFGTKLPVVDMTHAWGALFYGEAPSMTFPVPFIERPCVAIGVGNGQSAIVMSCNPSTTGISNLQFCRGTASNGTVIYDWLAMGKWK